MLEFQRISRTLSDKDVFLLMTSNSLTHQAYRLLYEQIISGRITAGDVLSEMRLAEEFGISRTPVGEAIRQLVHEGLLEQVPRFGTVVRQIDEIEMRDLFEMREALESYAVVRAASRITPRQIAQMKVLGEDMEATISKAQRQGLQFLDHGFLNRFLAADMAFHYLMISASGNAQIAKVVRQTRAILNIFRVHRGRHDLPLVQRVKMYHDRIVRALENADAEEAKQALLEHLDASKREALTYLRLHAGTTTPNAVLTLELPDDLKQRIAELELRAADAPATRKWRRVKRDKQKPARGKPTS
jgi:DNA-binding GntR family transcriptional regulator